MARVGGSLAHVRTDVALKHHEPTPFTSALRGLESAVDEDVLNLAATLTTRASDDDDNDNDDDHDHDDDAAGDMDEARARLRYLRTQQEHNEQRLTQSRERLRQLERTRDDLDHRDRLRRSMDRLNRLHEASAQAQYAPPYAPPYAQQQPAQPAQQHSTQYGESVPSLNRLYDWSPLPSADAGGDDERSLRALRSRLGLAASSHPATGAAAADSLRSTAMLQAVRRHPRFSASPSPQPQPPPPTVAPMLEHTVKYLSRIRHAASVDESLNCALDAGFLSKHHFCTQYPDFLTDTRAIPPPRETSWLAPGALLSGCQHATTSTSAPDFAAGQPPSTSTPDLAASRLPPPSRPWLSTSYSTPRSLASYLSPHLPSRRDPPQPPPHHDRWPVKVTIHAVDWSDMSLSATMEAYNVPSHPHQHLPTNPSPSAQYTRTSSITTYLEGEILDFNTHTLLTESFKSSAANDALYWRKLPPFRDMQDDDVVRALTSRRWWEGLSREWVLMRWKERCFVKSLRAGSKSASLPPVPGPLPDGFVSSTSTNQEEYYVYDSHTFARHAVSDARDDAPQLVDADHAAFDDSGCGLTISGFYYVCLRRSDGRVEGLYYDPMSSPYQCLMLESQGTGRFASWEFA